jgi:hypothetical protein
MIRFAAIFLALVGTQTAHAVSQAFTKKTPTALLNVPRGGAIIDAETAAKVAGGVFLAQGVAMTLAPKPQLNMFGDDSPNSASVELMRRIGCFQLASGIAAYTLIFNDYGVEKAIGLGLLPMTATLLSGLLNDNYSSTGLQKSGDIIGTLIFGGASLSNLLGLNWANTAAKAAAVLCLIGGVTMGFDQSLGYKTWFDRKVENEKEKATASAVGVTSLVAGTTISYLAWGGATDAVHALLRATFIFALGLLKWNYMGDGEAMVPGGPSDFLNLSTLVTIFITGLAATQFNTIIGK